MSQGQPSKNQASTNASPQPAVNNQPTGNQPITSTSSQAPPPPNGQARRNQPRPFSQSTTFVNIQPRPIPPPVTQVSSQLQFPANFGPGYFDGGRFAFPFMPSQMNINYGDPIVRCYSTQQNPLEVEISYPPPVISFTDNNGQRFQWNTLAPIHQQPGPRLLPQAGSRYLSVPTQSYNQLMQLINQQNQPDYHVMTEAQYNDAITTLERFLRLISGPAAQRLQAEIQRIERSVVKNNQQPGPTNTQTNGQSAQIQTVTMPYRLYILLFALVVEVNVRDVGSLQQTDPNHTVVPHDIYRLTIANATRAPPAAGAARPAAQTQMMQAPPQGQQTQGTLGAASQTQRMLVQHVNIPAQGTVSPAPQTQMVQAQLLNLPVPRTIGPAAQTQMMQPPSLNLPAQGTLRPATQNQNTQQQNLDLLAQVTIRTAAQTQMTQLQNLELLAQVAIRPAAPTQMMQVQLQNPPAPQQKKK